MTTKKQRGTSPAARKQTPTISRAERERQNNWPCEGVRNTAKRRKAILPSAHRPMMCSAKNHNVAVKKGTRINT